MATFDFTVTPLSLDISAADVDLARVFPFTVSPLGLSIAGPDVVIFFSSAVISVGTLELGISAPAVQIRLLQLVNLPNLVPEEGSEFTPPGHRVSKFRSQQGNTTNRLWASIPSDARLKVDFRYVDDDDAEAVRAAWMSARGRFGMLRLPSAWFAGLDGDLLNVYNLEGQRLRWAFAAPPEITSINEGHSDVSVQLKARSALGIGPMVNA